MGKFSTGTQLSKLYIIFVFCCFSEVNILPLCAGLFLNDIRATGVSIKGPRDVSLGAVFPKDLISHYYQTIAKQCARNINIDTLFIVFS